MRSPDVPVSAETAAQPIETLRIDVGGEIVVVPIDEVPDSIRSACPEFEIDAALLWGLELQPQSIAVTTVFWMLELPVWPERGIPFSLRPVDVIRMPGKHPEHAQRIERASLSFPIDVMLYRNRLVILEGCHRTAKATIEGAPTISARIVPPHRIPEIIDWTATARSFNLRLFMEREYGMNA
ncbi:hypothetical protein ACLQ25_32075 [Micromonospora sp. DT44]|uniref:hypothetical protein n=1 Tax=Micromonospora sp. DT44 TaxID=3393439 RepID=UPI003CFA471F